MQTQEEAQSNTARFNADKTAQSGHPGSNPDFIKGLISLAKKSTSVDEYSSSSTTTTFHYMASLYTLSKKVTIDVFESNNLLFYLLKHNPDEFVKNILSKFDIKLMSVKDLYENNLLHMAVFYRYGEVVKEIFNKLHDKDLFIEFVNARNKYGTNPIGMLFINSESYNDSNLLNESAKKVAKLFINQVKYDVNSCLNNKYGMDSDSETYLKHIAGFNILHMVLKCGANDLLSDLGLRNEQSLKNPNDYVNFFHPALNPDFHMTSPTSLLDVKSTKFAPLNKAVESCKPLLSDAQRTQQAKLDEDSSGDSEISGTPANFYKQELLNLAKFGDQHEQKIEKESASSLDHEILNTPIKTPTTSPGNQKSEEVDLNSAVVVFFHGVHLVQAQYGNCHRRELAKKLLPANPRIDEVGRISHQENSVLSIHSRTSTASSGVSNLHDAVSLANITQVLSNIDRELRLYLSRCQAKDQKEFLEAVKIYVYEFGDNPIKKFWDILKSIEEPSINSGIIKYRFPFISVSKAPDHPLKFAIGQNVKTQAKGQLPLNPKYNKADGFPCHRLVGFLYVTRHSLADIEKLKEENSCADVTQLVKSGQLSAQGSSRTNHQHEFTFFGGIKAEDVLFVVPIVYPNFKKSFSKEYHGKIWGLQNEDKRRSSYYDTAKKKFKIENVSSYDKNSVITSVGRVMMPAFVKLALKVAKVLLKEKNVVLLNANNDLEPFSFDYDNKSYWSCLQNELNKQKTTKTTPEKLSEQKRWQEKLKKQSEESDVCRKLLQNDAEENTSVLSLTSVSDLPVDVFNADAFCKLQENPEQMKEVYSIIPNSGGGDCGIYAVMHAMWGKQESDEAQALIIRNQLAEVMSGFVALYRYRESLDSSINADHTEVVGLYERIFGGSEEGFARFKFIALGTIRAPLSDETISEESRSSREKEATKLESISNWEGLLSEEGSKELVIYLFRDVCSDFGIDIRAAISDHNPPNGVVLDVETCTSEEYKEHVSKPGVWLDNHELAGYLLSMGYVQCGIKSGSNIGYSEGSIIEFKNASGEFVRLHNNAVDFDAGNMSQATGTHWQGAVAGEDEHGAGSSGMVPTNSNGANLRLPELALDVEDDGSCEETLSKILKQPTAYERKEKPQILKEMSESYKAALERHREGDLKNAETEFVKVIRPALSKSLMKEVLLGSEDTNAKLEILDSMYHLGLIYESGGLGYTNQWAKAAGIFMYCDAFVKKHKLEEELDDRDLYLKAASSVEGKFLNGSNDAELSEQGFRSYREDIARYKARLEGARDIAKSELEEITDLGIEEIAERANRVKNIYGDLGWFLITNEGDGLLQQLISKCREQLGGVPKEWEYSIFGLGSLSIGIITPWSDIEFGILINENKEEYKEYFRKLTQSLQIKIINLGESHLRGLGIESLNNFKTADELEDWFWDDVTASGISFDGAQWYACKSPLGRKGYKAVRKEKDANGSDVSIIEEKPDYELIGTLEEITSFQKDVKEREHSVSFSTDKHLVQSLRRVSLIDGSQDLLDRYRESVSQANAQEVFRARELEILKEDLEKFSLKLGDAEEGKLLDVKKDMYRLGDRILVSLANYYGIDAGDQELHISAWQIIERMRTREEPVLGQKGSQHLAEAISIAAELRLSTYSHNKGQLEGMSTYTPAVDHLDEARRKELVEKTFHIKDTAILHHFYYVMLRVQMLVKGFCNEEFRDIAEIALQRDNLHDGSDYNRGMVHARFLGYKEAMEYLELAAQANSTDASIMQSLFFLCGKLSETDKAIKIGYEILKIQIKKGDFIDYHSIATVLSNIGRLYCQKGMYEKSLKYFNLAYRAETYTHEDAVNKVAIANICSNIASVYGRQGKHDLAVKNYKKALTIYETAYVLDVNHPHIALCYNNMGISYFQIHDFQKSIACYDKALEIKLAIHNCHPNHPDIATTYENIAVLYSHKGEYNTAAQFSKQSLKIFLAIYAGYPNELIALSYHNLASVYYESGDYENGIKNCNKALDVMLIIHGNDPNSDDIMADIYNNLGNIHDSTGSHIKAIEYHEHALRIRLEIHKGNLYHRSIAMSYNNLGLSYSNAMLYEQAIGNYDKALETLKSMPYDAHDILASVYNNLGIVYHNNNENDRAIEYYQKALDVKEKFYGSDHPDLSSTYNNLGLISAEMQEYGKAIEYYSRSLKIRLKWCSTSNPDTTETYNNLNKVIQKIRKDSIASKLKSTTNQEWPVEERLDISGFGAGLTVEQLEGYCHESLGHDAIFSFSESLCNMNPTIASDTSKTDCQMDRLELETSREIDAYFPQRVLQTVRNKKTEGKFATTSDSLYSKNSVHISKSVIPLEEEDTEAAGALAFIQDYANHLSASALEDARDEEVIDALVKCFKTFQIYRCILEKDTSHYASTTTNLGCILLLTSSIQEYHDFLVHQEQDPEFCLSLLGAAVTKKVVINSLIEKLPLSDLGVSLTNARKAKSSPISLSESGVQP